MAEAGTNLHRNMINLIQYKKNIILAAIGAMLGFAYWYFVGCESGTCAITSVWWRITLYGALMGWLISDLIFNKNKLEKNEKN